MDGRWNYDHEYFQRMIDRQRRMNAEVVGCIITGMSKLNKDGSSSDGSSMSSLQDGGQSDWSSDDDTDSYGDDDMYDDGEWWGYKELTLEQIISGVHNGRFLASSTPTLYAFSLYGYAKVLTADISGAFLSVNQPGDFCQAKE